MYCGYCGCPLKGKEKFCPRCGRELPKAQAKESFKEKSAGNRRRRFAGGGRGGISVVEVSVGRAGKDTKRSGKAV